MISSQKLVKGLVVISSLCVSLQAFSWGYEGHRVVARIALDFLTNNLKNPEVATDISNILNNSPKGKPTGSQITLDMVASFADDLRSDPKYDALKPLHFANVGKDVTDYQTYAGKDPKGDVVVAILALGQYLNSNDLSSVNDVPAFVELQKNVKMTRPLALKLFVHFWGDVFQPLHLGYAEDMGGNAVDVYMQVNGRNTNLHSALDGILSPMLTSPTEYAGDLERMESTKTNAIAKRENLYAAVNDTLKLRSLFYKFTTYKTMKAKQDPNDPSKLLDPGAPDTRQVPVIDYAYMAKDRPVLEAQMIKAGVMLGYALEQIFTPNRVKGPNIFVPKKKKELIVTCEGMFGG